MTFYIEESQLLLKDSDRLDYEKQTQITIHIRTTDNGSPRMFTQVQWNNTNIAAAKKYFNTKLWNQNLSHIIQSVISLKKKKKVVSQTQQSLGSIFKERVSIGCSTEILRDKLQEGSYSVNGWKMHCSFAGIIAKSRT